MDNAVQVDDEIHYSATVWHFANWDPLMSFLKSKLGAVKTGWVSDEYCDPMDAISLV